jgi:sulfonate transport system permease protein
VSAGARVRRIGLRAFHALALPALALLVWELLSRQGPSWAFAFVPLSDIADSFKELWLTDEPVVHIRATLWTALQGLAYGTAAGLLVGLLMAASRAADTLLNPLIQALRQVPNLALIPLVALWFGNSEFSKLLVVSLAVFEVMVLNTYEGLHQVDRRYLEVAQALMLSRWSLFRRVLLPAAVPSIVTGLQHAVAFAWLSTVGVELLFTVGPGLSTVMERAQMAARMDQVIVCLIFIAALGYGMHVAVRAAAARLLRWRPAAFHR